MTTSKNHPCGKSNARERGSTLLVGMLIMTIMALIGLSAAVISKSDERMARNSRDRNIAFFAAEAALRDARDDIQGGNRIIDNNGATTTCDTVKGFCMPAVAGALQAWEVPFASARINRALSVEFGEFTLKPPLSPGSGYSGSLSQQPRYVIEVLPELFGNSLDATIQKKYLYRITALGFGTNADTRVLLQEVIRP